METYFRTLIFLLSSSYSLDKSHFVLDLHLNIQAETLRPIEVSHVRKDLHL